MPRITAPTIVEHRALRLDAILDATAKLLPPGAHLTVSAIADTAGLPRSSVYEYFPSADDAIRAARIRRDRLVLDASARLLASGAQVDRAMLRSACGDDALAAYATACVDAAIARMSAGAEPGLEADRCAEALAALCSAMREGPSHEALPTEGQR